MNGRSHETPFADDSLRADILNPFVHKLELETTFDKIKTAVFTVILLPFRVIVICYLMVTAWFLACIGLYGLSEQDLRSKPMTGWRSSKLRRVVHALMKLVVMAAGFHKVRVRGAQHAGTQGARVLLVAPHSSFFDAIAIVWLGAPSVVAKADTAKLPFIGPLRPLLCAIGKLSYLAGGMAITVRGRQVSRGEAPILVVAPHSSFLDSCIVYATKMSSVIVRKESMDNYVGKLINYTQPVYVWRDDPNSRQNTIKEIIERATSKDDWPQILIFPEGTCTNRSCLITFKPGGFYPGVPVQPVTIRYPNSLDTVTWTWEGPGALKLLWLTLTQVHSSCEIEFLPVYYPNEDEKRDPKLYARNVRDVMAKALGVPVLDYTYDDCRLIARGKHFGIPHATNIIEIQKLRTILGLDKSGIEIKLAEASAGGGGRWLDLAALSQKLGVPDHDPHLQRLFALTHQKASRMMDWNDYLLCAVFLTLQHASVESVLSYAFKIYDTSGCGRISQTNFEEIACKCLGMFQEDASHTFRLTDVEEKGYITFDEFIRYAEKQSEFIFIFTEDSPHAQTHTHKPKTQ